MRSWKGPTTRRIAAQTTTTNSSSSKPRLASRRNLASSCRTVKMLAARIAKSPSFQTAAALFQAAGDSWSRLHDATPKKYPKLYQEEHGAWYQRWLTGVCLPSALLARRREQRFGCARAKYVAKGSPKRLVSVK